MSSAPFSIRTLAASREVRDDHTHTPYFGILAIVANHRADGKVALGGVHRRSVEILTGGGASLARNPVARVNYIM